MRVGSGATLGAVAGLSLIGLAAIGGWDDARAQAEPESMEPGGGVGDALRQTAYIKASNTGFGDEFGAGGTLLGNAVALSADGITLAIGAPYESSGSSGIEGDQDDESVYGAGAVYVFVNDGVDWRQQAYVKASNPDLTDNFGYMIALSGDGNTMAVSAPFEASATTGIDGDENDDSIPQAGAVYVFSRSGEAWVQQAYIKASNTGEAGIGDQLSDGDQFGFALALSADGNTMAWARSRKTAPRPVSAPTSPIAQPCPQVRSMCTRARATPGHSKHTSSRRTRVGAIYSAIASR